MTNLCYFVLALKKSRGLARKLLGSCCDHEPARRTTSESSQQSADTEFQLMEQWRSLFLYTENALDHETSKIVSHFEIAHVFVGLKGLASCPMAGSQVGLSYV